MRSDEEIIITEGLPDHVPLASTFHHPYNRLSYYHPKIVDMDGVRVPHTEFFEFDSSKISDTGGAAFDTEEMYIWMRENGYQQAFLRSDYSSAKIHPREGSMIEQPEHDFVERTVMELVSQHYMTRRMIGGRLALREWIDLDYCTKQGPSHHHMTEVRYFIDDGDVLYVTPDAETFVEENRGCDSMYRYVENDLEYGIELPDEQIDSVCDVFDELSWSVDFVREAKTGDWYLTDMGMNGMYCTEDGGWVSISGHAGSGTVHDLDQYTDEMPDPEDVYGERLK